MTGALILAGRANTAALASISGAAVEALVEVAGRPMVLRVVEAARDCGRVGRVVVVGPREALRGALGTSGAEVVGAGGSLVDNLRLGLAALDGAQRTLVVPGDLPLLRGETLAALLARCDRDDARFYYAVVRRERYAERFPGSRRTYVRLRDGVFTGGNVFLTDRAVAEGALDLIERLYQARKSPLRLAGMLGLGFILRLLSGTLRIADVERKVSGLVGAPGRAVVTEHAEIAFDVDRPEDVAWAERHLGATGG